MPATTMAQLMLNLTNVSLVPKILNGTMEGRSYWGNQCCGWDYYGYCYDWCDDYRRVSTGVIIALVICIPLVIALIILVSCFFCSGCPLNKSRARKRNQRAEPHPFVIGQTPPHYGYYDAHGNYVIPPPPPPPPVRAHAKHRRNSSSDMTPKYPATHTSKSNHPQKKHGLHSRRRSS